MDEQPEILSFVKALASADRLRIIGVLVRGKATQSDIAEQLHLPLRDVFNHLSFLVNVGVVTKVSTTWMRKQSNPSPADNSRGNAQRSRPKVKNRRMPARC